MKRPSNEQFKSWHARSRVKHLVYHATIHDFDYFDTSKGDLGSHFGSLEQANNIATHRLSYHHEGGPLILPVWLQITNPLRLKDVGSFHADGIADQLERKGLLAKGEGKRIIKEIDLDWKLRKRYDPICLKAIIDAGYDGVVYANTFESSQYLACPWNIPDKSGCSHVKGNGDSYIVFNADQVIFAISNPHNNPSVRLKPRL